MTVRSSDEALTNWYNQTGINDSEWKISSHSEFGRTWLRVSAWGNKGSAILNAESPHSGFEIGISGLTVLWRESGDCDYPIHRVRDSGLGLTILSWGVSASESRFVVFRESEGKESSEEQKRGDSFGRLDWQHIRVIDIRYSEIRIIAARGKQIWWAWTFLQMIQVWLVATSRYALYSLARWVILSRQGWKWKPWITNSERHSGWTMSWFLDTSWRG